jgi:hypothetical protein
MVVASFAVCCFFFSDEARGGRSVPVRSRLGRRPTPEGLGLDRTGRRPTIERSGKKKRGGAGGKLLC